MVVLTELKDGSFILGDGTADQIEDHSGSILVHHFEARDGDENIDELQVVSNTLGGEWKRIA